MRTELLKDHNESIRNTKVAGEKEIKIFAVFL